MKKHVIVIGVILLLLAPKYHMTTFAWGDSDGGRTTYSLEEVSNDSLGDKITFNSIVCAGDQVNRTGGDFDWYKATHNGAEVPKGTILDERNYVGAREDTGINAGVDNVWEPNQIKVEEGKTYLVRLYVHNDNPNGSNAIAENVKVAFDIPTAYATKTTRINGYISSSNATPTDYIDYVDFISDSEVPFRMVYVYGSAKLENNADLTKNGGYQLSDNIIENDGIFIGHNELDGKIPGGYQYAQYISIQVYVEFDYYILEQNVRLAGKSEWQKTVEAKVGDTVEFLIEYTNKSNYTHTNVSIWDILPNNLEYIPGTTKLLNAKYPNWATFNDDTITTEEGINIGHYAPNSNSIVHFQAKVVDNCLADGWNALVNWSQVKAGANETKIVLQNSTKVMVYKDVKFQRKTTILYIITQTSHLNKCLCTLKIQS